MNLNWEEINFENERKTNRIIELQEENKVLKKALEMTCSLLHMDALDQCVECSENCDLCSPERYIKLAKESLRILGD